MLSNYARILNMPCETNKTHQQVQIQWLKSGHKNVGGRYSKIYPAVVKIKCFRVTQLYFT